MSKRGNVVVGPDLVRPILGEEGGTQRLHLGYYRHYWRRDNGEWWHARFGGFYVGIRLFGTYRWLAWSRA